MAKIIRLDTSRKKPSEKADQTPSGCEHKKVVVYERYRTVGCALCRSLLDPFDVLLDMVKGLYPVGAGEQGGGATGQEEVKRRKEPDDDNP